MCRINQCPEWVILSHVDCFIQGEVKWFQVLLDSLHPLGARTSWRSPSVLQVEAVKIFFASFSYRSRAMWLNRERCHAWTMAERGSWLVDHLHHHSAHAGTIWFSTACADTIGPEYWLILSASLLVTAQHSQPYRKIGRMQVLYSFSLVEIEIEIYDFQIWLSRFCIAAQVMELWCEISGELWKIHWKKIGDIVKTTC